jgi:hypothetical protein
MIYKTRIPEIKLRGSDVDKLLRIVTGMFNYFNSDHIPKDFYTWDEKQRLKEFAEYLIKEDNWIINTDGK